MTKTFSRRQALALGGGLAGAAAIGTAAAGSAAAAGAWVRLPVVTANIGRRNLGNREAAIRDVRNNSDSERPLVGWQEINEGDTGEPAMINQHFGGAYNNAFLNDGQSYRVPISVPAPWVVVNAVNTFVHGVVPNVSPPRWINEVTIQHNANPTLKFAILNTHYLAGAYNGEQSAANRVYWDQHKTIHRQRVMNYHNRGTAVFWTADTNNPNFDAATGQPNEGKAFPNGIDRVDWLPGNGSVQIQLLNTKLVPMSVDDHSARVAIFRVRTA
ncbi:hypothetical protein AB0P21_39640 [Kribbella sp. NPDC056861]|uniref:hypothetical protein n=1 Tax=Kribbella sp. NPDC056861 TaxID=3154857 RepID=UPI00343EF1B8